MKKVFLKITIKTAKFVTNLGKVIQLFKILSLTCFEYGDNKCLTCDHNKFREFSINKCICLQNYFENQGLC